MAAVLAGLVLCWAPVAFFVVQRYWGALGVFTQNDWLNLWPELFGRYFDHALGLVTAVAAWCFLPRVPRTLSAAMIVGALGSYFGLLLYVMLYLLVVQFDLFFWTFRLATITGPLQQIVLTLLTGAVLGAAMFLIAYRREGNGGCRRGRRRSIAGAHS